MKQKTNFIVFGQGRSGSNLLVDLLNSHPAIHCDMELLNKNQLARKNKIFRSFVYNFPYHYIKRKMKRSSSKLYGFKLMYHQLENHEKIRPKLFNENWKIIHIQRKDIFAQTLSTLIAKKTGKYIRKHQDVVDNIVLRIEPQSVAEDISLRLRAMKYELEVLIGLNYFDVVYENDLADSNSWNESMEGVFKYLGVPPIKVSATTLKTDNRTNEERISNYSEILEYLNNHGFNHLT